MSGLNNGILYKRNGAELSISNDYGSSFEVVTNPIVCPIRELGYYSGEFYGINGDIGMGLYLDHTLDYASTYTEIPIDSSVAFWSPSGQYPSISRGTEPGELYLTSWWPDYHYKIFHSTDTGYTWAEQHESEYIDIYYWGVQFTAGREPGTFYALRQTLNPGLDHKWLYIDYSTDYGQTFTTYYHALDSAASLENIEKQICIEAYPNPFYTSISFALPKDVVESKAFIEIFDIHGELIRRIECNSNEVKWDGTNQNGYILPNGLYLYRINSPKFISKPNKILYLK